MAKNAEKLVISALQKASKNAGAGGVPVTSKLETLKKLVPFPQGKPRTSPSSKSTVADKHRETSVGLADKFVLQLNRASAKTTAESVIHVQKSCAEVTREISSILPCDDELDSSVSESSSEVPDSNEFLNALDQRKKVISRSRKQKIIQKNMQSGHFIKLMSMCVERLDVESTMDVFSSVERETDMNDYSTLIKLWMEKARKGTVVDTSGFFKMMYQLFISMSERGFQILEDIYGPFLMYLIDMKMKEEFQVFSGFIKEYDHESLARIGYYEMLFWIKVGDECKIRELCNNMATVGDYHEQRLADCSGSCMNDAYPLMTLKNRLWKIAVEGENALQIYEAKDA